MGMGIMQSLTMGMGMQSPAAMWSSDISPLILPLRLSSSGQTYRVGVRVERVRGTRQG